MKVEPFLRTLSVTDRSCYTILYLTLLTIACAELRYSTDWRKDVCYFVVNDNGIKILRAAISGLRHKLKKGCKKKVV